MTLAKKWIKAGFLEVIITNGTKNTVYANSHRRISSYKIKSEKNIVDVTGAGDAFVAGLVYGIRNNKPPSQSIIYGKANSALTIRSNNSVNDELTPQILEKEVENQK